MAQKPTAQGSSTKQSPRKSISKAKKQEADTKSAVKSSAAKKTAAAPGSNGQAKRRSNLSVQESMDNHGLATAIKEFFHHSPSWLTSMVVHVVALLVLGLLMLPQVRDEVSRLLADVDEVTEVEDVVVDPLEEPKEFDLKLEDLFKSVQPENPTPEAAPSPIEEDDPAPLAFDLFKPENEADIFKRLGKGANSGTGISGRGPAARKAGLPEAGGTPESEEAVAMALRWLAEHQLYDGSWSFDHRLCRKCGGKCGNPGRLAEARFGATGLALMSFLGAGQTHKKGEYRKVVMRGLLWLTKNMQRPSGQMYRSGGKMYAHGIAAIALCEAAGMTDDRGLRRFAMLAVGFILKAQDPVGGGWRYSPRQAGDTSVVGWQLMALKSAKWAYIKIPPIHFAGVNNFLNTVQSASGAKYGYTTPGAGSATTAVGLLCRMYLGWKKDNGALERGVEFLSKVGPSKSNVYFNYYATQVMHHFAGEKWKKWNEELREYLIDTQSTNGHETGTWYFNGGHGASQGGRHYTTCMCCMTLEVYYRHLPLYQKKSIEDDFDE